MAQLIVGDRIPDFVAQTLSGGTLTQAQFSGRRILLSFRRYAACPVCNQHLATFRVRAAAELVPRKIEMFAVFHSPADRLLRYFDPAELPFGVIADPKFELYEAFGVTAKHAEDAEPLTGETGGPAVFCKVNLTDEDGTPNMIPANFMLDDGKVAAVHYGKHLSDAWSVEQALDVADRLWGINRAS